MIRPDGRTHLSVGLAQFKPKKAAVEANLTGIREVVGDHAGAVDLLVFPEAALSGYFLEGGVAWAAKDAISSHEHSAETGAFGRRPAPAVESLSLRIR